MKIFNIAWIRWALKVLRGKWRISLGFCPLCNSDAPELDNCPLCHSYSQASGDKFPPEKATKADWWLNYKYAIDAKLQIDVLISKAKKRI